ncbi:uncharacterized protein [Magallana gigas]|uniref:uncharacterized protein n=1 Tax=Magallana gigas TaxID=29159 RepID=UPI0033410F0E
MEGDGKDIMRRLNSDKLMSPTPELLRELPLSNIGERAERYHRIMMARTRTQLLLIDYLCQRRGINLQKTLERQRWEKSPESDLGPLVGLKHEAEDDLEKIKLRIIKLPRQEARDLLPMTAWRPITDLRQMMRRTTCTKIKMDAVNCAVRLQTM